MRLYLLFETDEWRTKNSKVCFGVFSSYELATQAAEINGLYDGSGSVVVECVDLDEFKELS